MNVSVDLCVVPVGLEGSLAPWVAQCHELIKQSGLDYELGPNGTAIEGSGMRCSLASSFVMSVCMLRVCLGFMPRSESILE